MLLAIEFLVALQAVFAFWAEVGGQYHLDLMFWPWKFGLSLAAAGLITAITASRKRIVVLAALLLITVAVAGVVTYYYHVNEPADDQQDDSAQTYQTRQEFVPRSIG